MHITAMTICIDEVYGTSVKPGSYSQFETACDKFNLDCFGGALQFEDLIFRMQNSRRHLWKI